MVKVTPAFIMQSADTVLYNGETVIDFNKYGSIMEQGKNMQTLFFVFTNMRLLVYKQHLKVKPILRFIGFLSWFFDDELFYTPEYEIFYNDIVGLQKSNLRLVDEGCMVVLRDGRSYIIWWPNQTFNSMVERFTKYVPEGTIQVAI
jgi:hypothetical protein